MGFSGLLGGNRKRERSPIGVNPDGSFPITEVGEADSTHCQIRDEGRLILCDGTPRDVSPPSPVLSFIAIGTQL